MATDYFKAFAKLRSDASPARWSAATNYRAPHKPFLLLSIMDLIAQNMVKSGFVQFNAELIDTFDLYWVKVVGPDKDGNSVLPFYHMKSEGFWHLVVVPGMEKVLAATQQIRSVGQLKQILLGAQLDEELFIILSDPKMRDELRRVLIETYFAPEIRSVLVEVGKITAESFQYSLELLNRLRGDFVLKEAPEVEERYLTESRSTAFRRIIVEAYNHTCAVCGIRIITPEGRTAVAAAHIVPWGFSHNDDPRNGMALCGLHHWTFDQGILSVSTNYQIKISPIVSTDDDTAKPFLGLADREIICPSDVTLYPAKDALKWHLKNVFRADAPLRLL